MAFTIVIYGAQYRGDASFQKRIEEFCIHALGSDISYISVIDCNISLAVRLADASFSSKPF